MQFIHIKFQLLITKNIKNYKKTICRQGLEGEEMNFEEITQEEITLFEDRILNLMNEMDIPDSLLSFILISIGSCLMYLELKDHKAKTQDIIAVLNDAVNTGLEKGRDIIESELD